MAAKKPMTAADMGRKRWKGVSKEKRTEITRRAVEARWERAKAAK